MVFRILFILFLALWLSGCGLSVKDTAARNRIHHVVLCWLKEPGNIEHREKIMAASRSFSNVAGVLEVRTGQVIQSDRDMVDDSFDVGIYFAFRTHEDMKKYITHPIHREAVKNVLLPLVDRMIVYDFME